jgi:hypothetical protein
LDFPWLGKCGVLFLLDLYIYFGFPLARLKWRILLKSVRLPLHIGYSYHSIKTLYRVLVKKREDSSPHIRYFLQSLPFPALPLSTVFPHHLFPLFVLPPSLRCFRHHQNYQSHLELTRTSLTHLGRTFPPPKLKGHIHLVCCYYYVPHPYRTCTLNE